MTALPTAGLFSNPATTNAIAKTAQDDLLAFIRQMLGGQAPSTLTITSGAVTATRGTHTVDTEALSASDDLDTISTANLPDGSWLLLFSADNARNVVVRHNQGGAGKILLADAASLTLDDTTQWLLLRRSGTDWVEIDRGYGNQKALARAFLGAAGLTDSNVFTRTQTWKRGSDVASAAALVLGDGNIFNVTGTTAIDSIASKGVGTIVWLRFVATLTLTHHATNLVLFTGANIVTAPGDWASLEEYGVGTWRMIDYGRADGTALTASSTFSMPAGAVMPYAGSSAPVGWLLCDGTAASRTTYAALFAAIGTTFGMGDGSTTFNLPDLRGRVAAGKDNMGGTAANRLTTAGSGINGASLGAAGGVQAHTLSTGEMPAHSHTMDTVSGSTATGQKVYTQEAGSAPATNATSTVGGGGAHQNTQPSLVLNYIIKT